MLGAALLSGARPEHAQVIVDLGGGRDRRARPPAGGARLDRDGRSQPLDPLHRRAVPGAEELPRVGRQGLDEAAPPLGVDRVEGQRALPRAAAPGDHGQRLARDRHRQVLQVVRARLDDADLLERLHLADRPGRPLRRGEGLRQGDERAAGVRLLHLAQHLRRPGGDDSPPRLAPFGPEVDDVVRRPDHLEVVLDHQHRVPAIDQPLQRRHQRGHVDHVQPGGRLVENVQRVVLRAAGQLLGQLDPLRLAAGEGRRGLAEGEVAEADLVEQLQGPRDLRVIGEKLEGFLDGHRQDVGDALALETNVERLRLEAVSATLLARHRHRGEELQLDVERPRALARLAATAADVEGDAALGVAAHATLRQAGEEIADQTENPGVGRGVGARGASDRRGVDADHLAEVFESLHPVVGLGPRRQSPGPPV